MGISVVSTILLINVLAFLAEQLNAAPLIEWFALWPYGLLVPAEARYGAYSFWPWQIVSYAFLHGSFLRPSRPSGSCWATA